LVVISDTVPLQALTGEFTKPTVLAGGALLTTNTAEPLEVPDEQLASLNAVTVYVLAPVRVGVTDTLCGLLMVGPKFTEFTPSLTVPLHGPVPVKFSVTVPDWVRHRLPPPVTAAVGAAMMVTDVLALVTQPLASVTVTV
jgi:hypothetical protein